MLQLSKPHLGRVLRCVVAAVLALVSSAGWGSGPRWSAGRTYFQAPNGQAVLWNTPQLQYYTDPGDLSAAVNHAAADQIVAAAASMWNVSISSVVLSQGGTLNEHVSGTNMYLGVSGPVFPADVQASNAAAKPIAILYDTDGSITDTLLGGGAGDPSNCRQNAVTESVDGITPAAQITHALIVLNGRCIGAAPEEHMEMQYKLGRAFGRMLGFGWSQANDNVWTGTPQATYQQALHWPLMHPVDIYCGPYAYQCLVQPFTLKTDDLASIASLYPVTTPGNGKTATYAEATYINGSVNFSNGQGMEGVNVVSRTRHEQTNATDTWDGVSSVTGYQFQQVGGNPVTPKGNSLASSFGSPYVDPGHYNLAWIPAPISDLWEDITLYTQTINPLYTGQYAVGPYIGAQVIPSGPPMSAEDGFVGAFNWGFLQMIATKDAGPCVTTRDGIERAPAPVDPSGWWTSTMCSYGHTAWSSLPVKAGRTLAIEVTSLDEGNLPTTGKLQPVIGLWDSTDPMGSLPTQASQTDSLNTTTLGMTSLLYANGTTARTLRLGLGDVRGDGRPDFRYKARLLYADSIAPAIVPANGGRVTISGMGFRNGNTVTIDGQAATVLSWSTTAIVAIAPSLSGSGFMDVTVADISTGSQTTMTGALSYGGAAQPNTLSILSSPADGAYLGTPAAPNLRVQVTLPDGTSPAVGAFVTVTATNATLGACADAATCTLATDPNGQVTTTITPTVAGTVSLTVTNGQTSVTATFVTGTATADVLRVTSLPSGTVYAGVPASATFGVQVLLGDGATPASGASVAVSAVNADLGACSGATGCSLMADQSGAISTTITPLAPGNVSLLATANGGMVSASFGAVRLPPDMVQLVSAPTNGTYGGRPAAIPFSVRVLYGDGATPAAGQAVALTATNATLAVCGGVRCIVSADGSGTVSTSVTPSSLGLVTLTGTAGGGAVTATFTAAPVPIDTVQLLSSPANGSYVGRVAVIPLVVQVIGGESGAPVAGAAVTLTTTNGILGACGSVACVLTADASGHVSTTVTPSFVGQATLSATEGGGQAMTRFTVISLPPDVLRVVSVPPDGSVVGTPSTTPFSVQVLLGESGRPAAGTTVAVRASNGTPGCGLWACNYVADANGMISAAITPTNPGTVGLTASEGGGNAAATFNAVAAIPDGLQLISVPADGSLAGQAAARPFAVQITVGNTGTQSPWAIALVFATNATLGACGRTACRIQADGTGKLSTTVIPIAPGLVVLSADEGGGTLSTSFNAASATNDRLHVVSQPSGAVYAALQAAAPFAVQVLLADGATPAAGATVTVGATNARLAACGGAISCVLTADSSGTITTGVTPSVAGLATLTASAGGGSVSAAFSVLALGPDVLHINSAPSGTVYVSEVAISNFTVQVMLGDGTTPAAGATVTLTSAGATFGACPTTPCLLRADSAGTITTTVTPTTVGNVTLTAATGGGMAAATFTAAVRPPDRIAVLSVPPDGSYVGQTSPSPFSIQVTRNDGTPAAGVSISLRASGAALAICGSPGCVVTSDRSGVATTAVTPLQAGPVTLTASNGSASASATFNAVPLLPDVVQTVSVPADGSAVGSVASPAFTVRVMLPDRVTPVAGLAVVLTASGGILGACGSSQCGMTSDVRGEVTTTVTPQASGTVTLVAAAGGGVATASFTAADPPDQVHVVSAPAGTVYTGFIAGTRFGVQVLLSDGITPAAGVAVTLSATGAIFGACSNPSCTLAADAYGMVSTTVTPTAPGAVSLQASAVGGTASAFFTALNPVRGITLVRTVEYVAPNVTVPWIDAANVFENGGAAAGTSVMWTSDLSGGLAFATGTTITDAQGSTANPATIGPMAIGGIATGQACVWTSVCSPISAIAVDPARWRLIVVSGAGQDVAVVDTLLPLAVRVVDDAGHWVAGAAVNLHQVVDGWVDCPPVGRCPIAPVLSESSASLTSDVDGLVSFAPLEVAGVRERIEVVLSAGPNGYTSLTLAKSH